MKRRCDGCEAALATTGGKNKEEILERRHGDNLRQETMGGRTETATDTIHYRSTDAADKHKEAGLRNFVLPQPDGKDYN